MNIFNTLIQISYLNSKSDYLNFIENELKTVTDVLTSAGYNINSNQGLIGPQSLKTVPDITNFTYFREVHFIYHGLKNNQWSSDPVDHLYFEGLKAFTITQYNSLP